VPEAATWPPEAGPHGRRSDSVTGIFWSLASSQERVTAYGRIVESIAAARCVILDGGLGTELPQAAGSKDALDEPLWGTRALIENPDAVLRVHRQYLEAGCDVISTNTWGLASALAANGPRLWTDRDQPVHWMDVGRRGLRLARQAVHEQGRDGESAVAFSLNGDVDSEEGRETVRLLARLFADEPQPPDLILVETLSLLTPTLDEAIEGLLATGRPVWLSFRRCRHGLCGIYGQHWGGPEGDAFGRAARRFEEMGIGALLINCIPPDHVEGMVSYLRDFTDLPLGVYPNLGYYSDRGWRFAPGIGGDEYAEMALRWREEGAQIIGGCCGVRPEHIAAAARRLEGTPPGHRRRAEEAVRANGDAPPAPAEPAATWTDRRRRPLYPLPFPDLSVEPGVAAPTEPSYMAWRYVFREGIGAHQRCLDMGCGTGILAVQLALNGAAHVRALDIDDRAIANTLANAFRNDVADRVTAETVDLYPWVPDERYEVIVASLYQRPTDPFERVSSHRPPDYWGRNLVDQLIAKLPEALAPEGVAYVVQLSLLSQQRTTEMLATAGFTAQAVDYTLFAFPPELGDSRTQIGRVEELSDAYHLRVGEQEVMVAYLLEVRHAPSSSTRVPGT
jgi:S-methylmethionine-dependent homocysteine/selenocysteine methylase/SAM-dependent methyltransferase